MKKTPWTKLLSLFLAIMMAVSCLPVSALAADALEEPKSPDSTSNVGDITDIEGDTPGQTVGNEDSASELTGGDKDDASEPTGGDKDGTSEPTGGDKDDASEPTGGTVDVDEVEIPAAPAASNAAGAETSEPSGGSNGTKTPIEFRNPADCAPDHEARYLSFSSTGWITSDTAYTIYLYGLTEPSAALTTASNVTAAGNPVLEGKYAIAGNNNKSLMHFTPETAYTNQCGFKNNQIGGCTNGHLFTFEAVASKTNAYRIHSVLDGGNQYYVTTTAAEGVTNPNNQKPMDELVMSSTGAEFYIFPVNADNPDGHYYIWYEVETETPDIPDTSYTPEQAEADGKDVHYFVKATGNGWTISDTAGTVTIKTGGASGTAVTEAFDANTAYQIYSTTYLYAPYSTNNKYSTAQGTYSNNHNDFKLIANADGTYKIQSVANSSLYMTQTMLDFNASGKAFNGVEFNSTGADFYITPANETNNGEYWIWYATKGQTQPPEPPAEDIEFHEPTEGMVQHYLDFCGNWGSVTTPAALELHGVANGVYTKDTDGINSGAYGIYDPTPANGSPRWMHAGSGETNQCGANTCGAPHQFTLAYNAGKQAYTIQSVSTGKYLTQTSTGNQLAMNDAPTWFYITPVNQTNNDGSYYIWWETEPQMGDAISAMFDNSPDNTWVFTGGADVEGGFDQTQGHRNFMGHFEEFIRWENTSGSGDGPNLTRQRFTVNTARGGLTLNDIVSEGGWKSLVTDFNPRAVVYMVGREDASSKTFNADLTSFITKSLALRENNGFAVIIKSYDSSLSDLNNTVDTVVSGLSADQKSRVVVVTPGNNITTMDARGHFELGRDLCEATCGIPSNKTYPTGKSWQDYTTAAAPTSYSGAAPTVAVEDGTMTITHADTFQYEVRLDTGVTISGTADGSADVPGVGEAGYTVVTRSADGTTQYPTVTSETTLTSQQQAISSLIEGKDDAPITWLFMGDSITHGAAHTYGYDSVSQSFDKYLDMIGRPQDVVINSAVSGATTTSTLKAIEQRLNQYSPDVVSIMIGTNDLSGTTSLDNGYVTRLEQIITAIKTKNKDAIIILRSPTGSRSGNHTRPIGGKTNTQVYCEAMKGVAEAKGLIYVDQFTDMQAAFNAYTWVSNNNVLSSDNLHPGGPTQLEMTKLFIKAIGLWDEDTPLANLNYEVTTAQSGTLAQNALIAVENRISLTVPSGMGQTTLTATKDGQSWSVTAKAGETPTLTLPDGTYSVTASCVSKTAAKTVNYSSVSVKLPADGSDSKFPAPGGAYEYHVTSGNIDPGVYMIVGTTAEDANNQPRILHIGPGAAQINQCKSGSNTPGVETLSNACGNNHLFEVAQTEGGYTFKSLFSNKYLTGSGATFSVSDTATVFTVTALDGGGYNLSWDNNGTTQYVSWNSSWGTSTSAYKLDLYRQISVPVSGTPAQTVFTGKTNRPMNPDDPDTYYRIPSLTTLSNGWIMAASDIRWYSTNDSPNNLDTIVSISKDGGQNWEYEVVNYLSDYAPIKQLGQPYGPAKGGSASFIDPAVVQDSLGTIYLLVDLQPPYINGGKIGAGFDSQGRLLVGYIPVADGYTMGNNRDPIPYTYDYYVDINNAEAGTVRAVDMTALGGEESVTVKLWPVCSSTGDVPTGYYADAFFNTYYDYGEDNGGFKPVIAQQHDSSHIIHNNLFYTQSDWKAFPTAFIMLRTATVNETTGKLDWSEPYLLNGQIKRSGEYFIGVCPGRGTTAVVNGTERIIFPLYDNSTGNELASVIYSDDHGATWTRGERTPNVSANNTGKSSESQIVVLPRSSDPADGTFLRMYSRNGRPTISYADSYDGGATWSVSKRDPALNANNQDGQGCMVSFINVAGYLVGPDGTIYRNLVMASYPQGTANGGTVKRSNGAIRIGWYDPASNGGDIHWLNAETTRYPGSYIYSCLTQYLDENENPTSQFGLLYETESGKPNSAGNNFTDIVFAHFTMADLLGENWSWVLEKPAESAIPEISIGSIADSKNTHDTDLVDVDVSGTATVTAITENADGAAISWTVADETVATVNPDGVVTGVAPGKTTVTASITANGITRVTHVEVVVQGDGRITLPDRYADEAVPNIIPAKTQYELATSGLKPGIYSIVPGTGRVVGMHDSGSTTNQCGTTITGNTVNIIHDAHKWTVARQENGKYTIRSNGGKYLTSTASGNQLALNTAAEGFTVTHIGNGVYTVQNAAHKYVAFPDTNAAKWGMSDTTFGLKFFAKTDYEASATYTAKAGGLGALIEALDETGSYTETLALAQTYATEIEANESQAQIEALAKELYRKLRGDQVTVTIDGKEHTVNYGGKLGGILPPDPVKEGHAFSGWFSNGVEVDADTVVTSAMTIVSKWDINTYTVTVDGKEHKVEYDTPLKNLLDTITPTTEEEGVHFDKWVDGEGSEIEEDAAVTGAMTITAVWAKNEYTVTLDPAGGAIEGGNTVTVRHGETVTLPTPTRSGYTFQGWFDGDTQVTAETVITGARTVTARWTPIQTPTPPTPPTTPVTPSRPTPPQVEVEEPDVPLAELPLPFEDVKDGDWYREAVAYVWSNDLMLGTGDKVFGVDTNTTRGMMVTMLYRLEKEPDTTFMNTFDDVNDGKWFSQAITWANENGVVAGYGNGKFGPDDDVTREQLVVMLYRYAAKKGFDVSKREDLGKFADTGKVSGYAQEAMSWAVAEGIIVGRDNDLAPTSLALRVEVAVVFQRFAARYLTETIV